MTAFQPRRWAIAVLAVVAVATIALLVGPHLTSWSAWLAEQGTAGLVGFIGVYALATVAALPGSLLTLAAGALLGVGQGTACVFIGAVVGSSIAFLLARSLARPIVERRIGRDPRFLRIDRAVARQGWKMILLLRLSPLLPYNALNYALGLTGVRFRDYLLGAVGMLPGTLLYVYSGAVAGELALVAGGGAIERGPLHLLLLGIGLVATAFVTLWIGRIARSALQEELPTTEPEG